MTATATTNGTTTNANQAANPTANAFANAETCCRTAADTLRKNVDLGMNASSTMASAMMQAWTSAWKAVGAMPTPTAPSADAVKTWPMDCMNAVREATNVGTTFMHGVIDAQARFAQESTAMAVDALRANARLVERSLAVTTDAVRSAVESMPAATQKATSGCNAKNAAPAFEAMANESREIFVDACNAVSTMADRATATNVTFVKNVAKATETAFVRN
ncbi:MAG: hypothetical protein JNM94_08905 [Phycisphaerae bacterium]|nr:hypothetical protein [Phycisphaerae bacterium]